MSFKRNFSTVARVHESETDNYTCSIQARTNAFDPSFWLGCELSVDYAAKAVNDMGIILQEGYCLKVGKAVKTAAPEMSPELKKAVAAALAEQEAQQQQQTVAVPMY